MRPVHFAITRSRSHSAASFGEALIADGEVLRAMIEGELAREAARQLDRLDDARADAPAGDATALEDLDAVPAIDQRPRRRQARDAGADDGDSHSGPQAS